MLGAVPETKSILLILWIDHTTPEPALHKQRKVLVLLMVPGNCNPCQCDPKIYFIIFFIVFTSILGTWQAWKRLERIMKWNPTWKQTKRNWNWEAKPHKLSLQSLHLQYGIHDGTFVQCTTCRVSRISHQVPSSKLRNKHWRKTLICLFIFRIWRSKVRISHLVSLTQAIMPSWRNLSGLLGISLFHFDRCACVLQRSKRTMWWLKDSNNANLQIFCLMLLWHLKSIYSILRCFRYVLSKWKWDNNILALLPNFLEKITTHLQSVFTTPCEER